MLMGGGTGRCPRWQRLATRAAKAQATYVVRSEVQYFCLYFLMFFRSTFYRETEKRGLRGSRTLDRAESSVRAARSRAAARKLRFTDTRDVTRERLALHCLLTRLKIPGRAKAECARRRPSSPATPWSGLTRRRDRRRTSTTPS